MDQRVHGGHVIAVESLNHRLGQASPRGDERGGFGRAVEPVRGIDAHDHAQPSRAVIIREAQLVVPDQGFRRASGEKGIPRRTDLDERRVCAAGPEIDGGERQVQVGARWEPGESHAIGARRQGGPRGYELFGAAADQRPGQRRGDYGDEKRASSRVRPPHDAAWFIRWNISSRSAREALLARWENPYAISGSPWRSPIITALMNSSTGTPKL